MTHDPVFFLDSVHYPIYEMPAVLQNVNIQLPRTEGPVEEAIPEILAFLDTFYFDRCKDVSVYVPGRPSSIARFCLEGGIRGTCYNDAILLNFILQKMGFRARNVVLDFKDGYGGSGHVVVEVWIPGKEKWILMDAQNLAVFRDSLTGQFLSAFEVRRKLLSGDSADVVAIQYGRNYLYPVGKLKRYYAERIPLIVLVRNSNFESIYARSPVMQILEHLEVACGKPCFLGARFLRMLLVREERVVYMDEYTPEVNFYLWRNIFLFLLAGVVVSFLVYLILGALIFWRRVR